MSKSVQISFQVNSCKTCPFLSPGFPGGWVCASPKQPAIKPPFRLDAHLESCPDDIISWCPWKEQNETGSLPEGD